MDQQQRQFLLDLQSLYKQVQKARSVCHCPNCNAKAIFSHVFSRKHILQPFCPQSKIYLFEPRELISIAEDDMLHYYYRGLKNAFGFHGFCSEHDNKLFAEIEPSTGFVDWQMIRNQYLLSYRNVCRELYANRTIHDVLKHQLLYSVSNVPNYHLNIWQTLSQIDQSNTNFVNYKGFLENGIFNNDYSNIYFHCIELPFQLDLCIAAPIYVNDGRGPCFKYDYQEVNIVNVFPYYGKTIILLGYSPNFDNKWLNKVLPLFTSPYPHIVSSALTDILYRAELNAIGPKTYSKMDKDLVDAYYLTYREQANCFDMELETVQNLLYSPLKDIMPDNWKNLL